MTAVQYTAAGQWAPTPPATVLADLTADGSQIILVADGDPFDLQQIKARLDALTANVTPIEENGQPTDAASVPATWANLVQLGFSFNSPGFRWVPGERLNEWAIAETIRRTSPVPPLPDDLLPPWLERTPRDYQLAGAAQIAAEGKFLVFDDPGTGKTATILLGLEARRQAGANIFPLLIVVPSWEVGTAWCDEIAAWELDWPERIIHKGSKRLGHQPGLRRQPYPDTGVFITTYATLRGDAADMKGPLVRLAPAAVVADEVHLAKNPQAQQSRALVRVARHAPVMIGATGTPVKHDTTDIHPVLEAMDERSWPSAKRMKARFCSVIDNGYDEKVVGLDPAAEAEFFAIMDRNMRRVSKADVLPELPPKIYSVRRPEIPPEWVRAYNTLADDMLARMPDGPDLPVMETVVQAMRLSQLASCAADVEVTQEWDDRLGMFKPKYNVTLKPPSWKAESLLGIIAERQHEPVVCFTASRQLALITGRAYCEKRGLRTGYVTGVGDGITTKTRQRDIENFQAGKLDVIVCTAKAGSTGITLTRAGTAVFLQRDLELDHGVQPEDRIHRIGQKNAVAEIIDVVARGTVEDRVRQLLRQKAGMLGQLVRDPRIMRELLGGIR